jgi:2-iminobutanoate/2-iminopropanoate deaminase
VEKREKHAVTSAQAPRALGPYAQAVRAGEWLFLSGQLGIDPNSGELVAEDAGRQAAQALANLAAVLAAAGAELTDVVKTTVFLVDLADFAEVNEVYASVFSPPYPARTTVGVASLPRGARVEIDAIAYCGR